MLKNDSALTELIVEALYKESKKEATEYRRFALKAFSDVLHELNVDRFTQVYEIAQNIFSKVSSSSKYNKKINETKYYINFFGF